MAWSQRDSLKKRGTDSLHRAVVRGAVGCSVCLDKQQRAWAIPRRVGRDPLHRQTRRGICRAQPPTPASLQLTSGEKPLSSHSQMQAGVYIYMPSCPCGVLVGRDFIIIKNMFLFHYISTTYYSLIYFLTQPRGLYCCTSRSLTSNIFNLLSY